MSNLYLISNEAWEFLDRDENKIVVLNEAFNINIHLPMFAKETIYDGIVILHYQDTFIEGIIQAGMLEQKEIIILNPLLKDMSLKWWTVANLKRPGVISCI